jgi:hypothetical protein
VLVAAAVCPHPPLLLPGLTGSADVGADLRAVCRAAVDEALAARPERLVVVGGGPTTTTWDPRMPVDPSPWGGPPARTSGAGPRLPLSLLVGRSLLDGDSCPSEVVLQGVASEAPPEACAALGAALGAGPRTALLVMGDGSARRGAKAPGYVDDRAHELDQRAADALATGDADALAAIDPAVAAELLVAGRAAWQVLAGALGSKRADARLLHADDPFGVLYLVATWRVLD